MFPRPQILPLLLVILAILLAGCVEAGDCCEPARDGVLVHLRSGPEDAQSALMGLQMAKLMSGDHDVIVYVDIRGIALLVEDGANPTLAPFGDARGLLAALDEAGVPVMACPTCLEVAGKTPSDLLPGIGVASEEPFFGFTSGRILTLDY